MSAVLAFIFYLSSHLHIVTFLSKQAFGSMNKPVFISCFGLFVYLLFLFTFLVFFSLDQNKTLNPRKLYEAVENRAIVSSVFRFLLYSTCLRKLIYEGSSNVNYF